MTTNQTIDGVPRALAPCPFCGESDLKHAAFRSALDVHYKIYCTNCGGQCEGQTTDDAVKWWNNRPGESSGRIAKMWLKLISDCIPDGYPSDPAVAVQDMANDLRKSVELLKGSMPLPEHEFFMNKLRREFLDAQPAQIAFPGYQPVPEDRKFPEAVAVVKTCCGSCPGGCTIGNKP
ncbi:Lar family restriction alleviation protein [Pseudomonas sp. 7-41]|uniref:Lar family restriction alleviation protein n=1 Tax=Pseudomonas sp. 7-41 TaxID=2898483 RepID=UPI001E3BD937|nr:Lar family restriction alleviation protein [Pseudomonas sp. 7-41]UHG99162.1 Lar family restriction alleviation protein [Pseudomonas sp. 7-41]